MLLFSVATLCHSQERIYNFEHFYARDGHPLSNVWDIKEDKLGFIWMASAEGLVRFDGMNFKKFYHDPQDPTSIDNNVVTSILPHSDDHIYVCTDGYGLNIYNPKTNIFSKPRFQKDSIAIDIPKNVYYMYEDYRNFIWMSDHNGIYIYDPVQDSLWIPEGFDPTEYGYSQQEKFILYECKEDNIDPNVLWLGSSLGLFEINVPNMKVSMWSQKNKDKKTPKLMNIRQVYHSNSDTLNIVTVGGGIITFNKKTKEFSTYEIQLNNASNWASGLKDQNTLWLAETDRLSSYDLKSKSYCKIDLFDAPHYNFSYADIKNIFVDSDKSFWLGRTSGISRFSKSANRFEVYKMNEAENQTFVKTAFYDISNDHTYMASKAGILVFEGDNYNNINRIIPPPQSDNVQNKFVFPRNVRSYNGYYYTISLNKIWRFKSDSDTLELYHKVRTSSTNGFEIDSKGNMWIFPWYHGLIRFNIDEKESELINFEDHKQSHIYKQMYIDSIDNVYYGVDDGLMKLMPSQDTFTHQLFEESQNGIKLKNVTGITSDKNGNLIFASDESGLFDFNMTTNEISQISNFTNVNNLEVDQNGHIWATTDNSLNRIDPTNGDLNAYNILDGVPVQNLEMIGMSSIKDDEIFVGMNSTYMVVPNGDNYINDKPYSSHIISLEVNGDSWSGEGEILYQNEIELSNKENYLRFGYSSMNYDQIQKNKFRYKLEGYDRDWSKVTSENIATYTRIPPGNYSFKVINANNDGLWNMDPATLIVNIKPAWYQTIWFKALMSILFVYLVWLLYKWRTKQIANAAKLKSEFDLKISELEMKSLKAQMNPHFIFNSLNSIKHHALTKSEKETALFINDFSSLIRRIFENSKHRTISIKDELKMLDLYIAIEKRRLGDKFNYNITVDESLDQDNIEMPSMILQPHVENAIWHGLMHREGEGLLEIEIKDKGNNIFCIISDNGIGRKRSSEFKNQGLANIRKSSGTRITSERIDLIKKIFNREASIHIEDKISHDGSSLGTAVNLTLPKL